MAAEEPLRPFVPFPGVSGAYVDTANISAFDLDADWGLTTLLAAVDWDPVSAQTILALHSGSEGINVFLDLSGRLNAFHGDGVSNRVVIFDAFTFLNGTTHLLRLEWDNSAPLVSLYVDGDAAAFDTQTPPNTNDGVGSGEDLHIGAAPGGTGGLWIGGIYYVQLRDDAGDEIAMFEAADALAVV